MGENGAGKSTLIKALTGVYPIDSGTIAVDGEERVFSATADAQTAGISTVYQEVNLCANLSVGENVMLGHEPRGRAGIDWKAVHRLAAEHLAGLGLAVDTRSILSSHSIAIQQLVAISRAMVLDAKVLILDEPTSSLDRGEVERLFAVIRELRDQGVAILFVSHFLEQVYEISDRITVLRNGRLVGEHLAADLPRDSLVSQMIGRELDELEAISRTADRVIDRTAAPVLRATGIGRRGMLEPADLDIYEGEVVGLAGLLGSGRTELVRLLYGADKADSGTVEIGGRPARLTSPRHAIDHRIAFSSEDRRAEGIIADLTVAENIVLGIQAKRGWMRPVPPCRARPGGLGVHLGTRGATGRPGHAGAQSVGRQPAEGAPRPLAGDRAAADHPRRAHPRHRRRGEGRHPAQGRRALGAGPVCRVHLIGARRSASIGTASRRHARSTPHRRAGLQHRRPRSAHRLHRQ